MAQKTIAEYLNQLPEPYKSQALHNAEPEKLEQLTNNLPNALNWAFNWDTSFEGYMYWEYYHQHLCI